MINNVRFLRGTETQWQLSSNASRTLEEGEIAIEYTINEFNDISGSRIKIGQNLAYNATPYLFEEERSQLGNRPNEVLFNSIDNKLFILDGENQTEINLLSNINIDDLIGEDQNLVSDIDLIELQKLSLAEPKVVSFLLSPSLSRKTGQALNSGSYQFIITLENADSLHETEGGRIEVSGGTWTGLTFNLKSNQTATINLSSNLTYNSPTTLEFKIFTKDIYGVEREQTSIVEIKWKAELWYGSSLNKNVTNLNNLSNLLSKEFQEINEIGSIEFIHSGNDRFDYIAIENSVSNYDIRNYYTDGIRNSFGMGEGLEIKKVQDITFGNKSYSLYVSNDSSFANTKAIITNASS